MSGPYILAESNFFINLFACHIYVNSMLYYSYDKTSVDPEDREGTQNLNLVPYSILDKKLRIIGILMNMHLTPVLHSSSQRLGTGPGVPKLS